MPGAEVTGGRARVPSSSATPAEVVPVDVGADTASQPAAHLLIEAEVDPTVNTRIVDVVRDLLESGVVQDHVGNGRVRERDVVGSAAEDLLGDRPRRVARGCMGRRIARETGRDDEGCPDRIWFGPRVVVAVAGADRCDWPPEDIVVLGLH